MNISELIERLTEVKKANGDITCVVQGGGDPSDWEPFKYIEVWNAKDKMPWEDFEPQENACFLGDCWLGDKYEKSA